MIFPRKTIPVINYSKISTTEENIKKYKSIYPNLKHVKTGKDFKGIMLLDKDEFVGIVQCNTNTDYIVALEVSPKFRNQGIATYLLNYAKNELNVHKLSVNKKNTNAIDLYKKNNYRVIKQDEHMFYMSS
jgi:ribosomal protein S18 acetylase RimI-like enzyme